MNWKRILTAGVLAGALTLHSAAALTVNIGGRDLSAQCYAENGTTYVPIRAASQQLGDVAVKWSGGAARVISSQLTLTAKPGELWLEANGQYFYTAGGVQASGGSVMVPVRALAAAMGASVEWDSASQTVRVTAGSGVPVASSYNETDLYWLSRIISAESQGEPMLGKLAVGTVVLNRVASAEFPNTIYDVIFDQEWGVQFAPVSNGTIYNQPTAESVTAAKLVLDGARAAGASLYFLDPTQTSNHWTIYNRSYVTTIGCHQFYA